jgi:hypothetical protein
MLMQVSEGAEAWVGVEGEAEAEVLGLGGVVVDPPYLLRIFRVNLLA